MSYFDRVLDFVDMTKEEFFELYNLSEKDREVKLEELRTSTREDEYNKYGDYMHLKIAYRILLEEGK